MKKLRKLFALLLCTALCLSLAPGAGAESRDNYSEINALEVLQDLVDNSEMLQTGETVMLEAKDAEAERIKNQINKTYETARMQFGKSFNGWCGEYVGRQLRILGICNSEPFYNGNNYYDNYKNLNITSGGYLVTAYAPVKAITRSNTNANLLSFMNTITSNGTIDVYNILLGFQSSDNDGGNGHVLFIHAILDGMVYWSESGSAGSDFKYIEGKPIVQTIEAFARYYGYWTTYEGAIVFLDDPTPDSPDLTVTANDATGVTSNDATLTGFIHFGNYQPTHWGVDCGTSSSNLPCVIFNDSSKQVINSSTGVSISFNFKNDSTSDPNSPSTPYYPLKANTTYYYRFWVKYGNDQYVHSEIKQFTTGNATIPSFSNISVSNITSTTAKLNYTINYGADNVPKYYGLYLGTSEGEMTKAVLNMQQYNESTYVNSTHQPIAGTNLEKRWPSGPINGNSIAFGSEGPTLSPATTYYYKLWITDNSGDHEYCSAVQSFTTSGSAVAVTGITLDSASLTMTGGTSQKLTATVSPSNATNKNVTWSSSNPSVATVSSDGVVNAVQGGTATITATTSDGGKTASCTVTVKDVHTFRFDANGGSGSMNSVSACMGEAVVFPPCAFTRPGYTFLGWYGYRANDRTFFAADVGWRTEEAIAQAGLIKQIYHDRLYIVIDNSWIDGVNGPCTFIMYAAWKANDYTVTYDANGGTGAPAAQTKEPSVALTLSAVAPTRTNSSAGSYTVTLNANGGSVSPTSLNAARTTSYTFKNWNTAADGNGTSYAPGAAYSTDANVTLYAQWNSSTTTAAVALPTPTRDGYVFKGWGKSSTSTSGVTGSYTPTRDLTLYAIWQSPDFILPDSLTTIEAEAFEGGAFTYVQLPEGVTSIGSRAFADCPNLAYIYIPEETGTIASDAFSGVSGLTILGHSGSYAEVYAQRNGIAFVAVE